MSSSTPFLKCPPEIRNLIYDEIFHHEDPIELELSLPGDVPARLQCSVPGINLLTASRQLYKEALASVYSQNGFVIHYNNLSYMWRWINAIGHSRSLLRNIYINFGWENRNPPRQLDVREILNAMWSQPLSQLKFYFITKPPYSPYELWLFPPGLNNVLAALSPAVSPQLQVFVRSSRTVHSAVIDAYGHYLCLTLSTSHHVGKYAMPTIQYDLSTTGELRRAPPISYTPDFDDIWLLQSVQTRVVNTFEQLRTPVVYDLTHKTISQSFPAALHVDEGFRSAFMKKFETLSGGRKKNEIAFKVQLLTHESITSFGEYLVLEEWVAHGRPRSFEFGGGRTRRDPYYNGPLITLSFRLAEHTDLETIRIEVTALVHATLSLSLESTLCVQLLQVAKDSMPIVKAYSTLYRLRRALLVFFSDLLATNHGNKHTARPRVWADGYLRIREAEFDSGNGNTSVVINDKYKWNPSRLNKEKDVALRRFATGATTLSCGCTWCFDRTQLSHARSDTLLTYTTFLARLVRLYIHLEVNGWGSRYKKVYAGCCSYP